MFRTLAALLITAVAVTVPVAQGATPPDDRAVRGAAVAPDVFERAVIRAGVGESPDAFERAVLRAESSPAVRPDDRGAARGPGSILTTSPTSPVGDGGFSWDSETLGAVGLLALCIVALGGLGLVRQHRRVAAH